MTDCIGKYIGTMNDARKALHAVRGVMMLAFYGYHHRFHGFKVIPKGLICDDDLINRDSFSRILTYY